MGTKMVTKLDSQKKVSDAIAEKEAYVVRTTDNDILYQSSSGGLFTPLALYILKQGGEVYAVKFDDTFSVLHSKLELDDFEENAEMFRGSKYVQSSLGNTFSLVQESVIAGRLVLFWGTPCQVSGLKSYLRRDYDNLFTVDIVCHGVSSPSLWQRHIDYLEHRFGSKISNVNMRSKELGYHSSTMRVDFSNEKKYIASPRTDVFLKAFFSNNSSRPSCYCCSFKGVERCSDLTAFDSWYPDKLVSGLTDDNKGFTNIICQTSRGGLLNSIEGIEIYPVDLNLMLPKKGGMVSNSAPIGNSRKHFYNIIHANEYRKDAYRFLKISKLDRLIDCLKVVIKRLGFLDFIMKIKKKFL